MTPAIMATMLPNPSWRSRLQLIGAGLIALGAFKVAAGALGDVLTALMYSGDRQVAGNLNVVTLLPSWGLYPSLMLLIGVGIAGGSGSDGEDPIGPEWRRRLLILAIAGACCLVTLEILHTLALGLSRAPSALGFRYELAWRLSRTVESLADPLLTVVVIWLAVHGLIAQDSSREEFGDAEERDGDERALDREAALLPRTPVARALAAGTAGVVVGGLCGGIIIASVSSARHGHLSRVGTPGTLAVHHSTRTSLWLTE